LIISQRNMLTWTILCRAAGAHHARAIECWACLTAHTYRPV